MSSIQHRTIPSPLSLAEVTPAAASADWLSRWLLTDRLVDAEVEANADSVSEFLRRLAEPAPCPAWCTTDHANPERLRMDEETAVREHSREILRVARGSRKSLVVEVNACDALDIGGRSRADIWAYGVEDGMTPEDAELLAEALPKAARTIRRSAAHRPDCPPYDERQASKPACPPWCRVNHAADGIRFAEEDGVRECSAESDPIPSLTHGTISAEAVRFTDLVSGRVRPPVVRVGDETLSPENALRLADQIRAAAGLATGRQASSAAAVPEQRHRMAGGYGGGLDGYGARCTCGVSYGGFSEMATPMELLNRHIADETPRRSWCESDVNHVCDGTDCASPSVDILATAGVKAGIDGGGVRVPIVSVYAQTDEAGQPGVHVYIEGPISLDTDREAWAVLTPAEARRYAAELLAHADLSERA